MTSEEIKEAAEYVTPIRRGAQTGVRRNMCITSTIDVWDLVTQLEQHHKTLSDWVLARLAADEQREREDAEPITDRLLAEFGPEKQFGEALFVSANFSVRDATIRVSGVEGDAKGFQICLGELCFITTRGQLRKLLEALKGGAS